MVVPPGRRSAGEPRLLSVAPSDDDLVLCPFAHRNDAQTTWLLNRPDGRTFMLKMRLWHSNARPDQRVHPGHDWLLVLEGRVRLRLGERQIDVAQGEAAKFTTTVPHRITALDDPAELRVIFDRGERRAHVHR